ncbi:beta-1,6-N-acetylglucosaminyltransferase [Paracoccus sp. DMF-8]|uniref:DUF5927 domain-containing protein n=1 Tax=Paracoccus sp. DMF-8 TaxID=3019445 RepID=UPI0023E8CAAE|nr:beta-1,6-N-acetylglucosaminyltransferase [Paracoccus sp. DMF-8]MDF3606924.1 beta-1,6-N-acetylglucosaminyltransferase [Paracoccus sp. DMF-8]
MTMAVAGGRQVKLGVVMLCHNELALAARMVRTWVTGGAAVSVHVDARTPDAEVAGMQAALADQRDVVFCRRRPCEWGMFGMVDATQEAAAMLLDRFEHVTHVLLVSGSCLPLRPIADLVAFLQRHPQRDFLESVTAVDVGWTVGGLNEERFTLRFPFSFRHRRWLFDNYVDLQRRLRVRRRIPEGIVPHLGSQWWCLTRGTLTAILTDPRRPEFDRYFQRVWVPDESYFQTLARRHSVNIESRSLTLAKFDDQGKPYIFYEDHRQMLEESGCFIARKIWPHATGLYDYFPRPAGVAPSAAEPQPARIGRLINRAVARRNLGRPGLYMQSRFPRQDCENGKTAAPYAVLYGFSDMFPGFQEWLQARVDADVHGHLLAPDEVEFAGGAQVGPGALPNSAALRDLDPKGFLANLIRASNRTQIWQFSPRDRQNLNWFMATDPNARLFVITGAWALPLYQSGMPFDDVRRIAAILQRKETDMLAVLQSVWLKARVHSWNLADFSARPAAALQTVVQRLGGEPAQAADPPAIRDLTGIGRFFQRLRNAGLRPQNMGDFAVEEPPQKAGPT